MANQYMPKIFHDSHKNPPTSLPTYLMLGSYLKNPLQCISVIIDSHCNENNQLTLFPLVQVIVQILQSLTVSEALRFSSGFQCFFIFKAGFISTSMEFLEINIRIGIVSYVSSDKYNVIDISSLKFWLKHFFKKM